MLSSAILEPHRLVSVDRLRLPLASFPETCLFNRYWPRVSTSTSASCRMILQHVKALNAIKVVLASASPRRKEILGNIGVNVEVVPSSFEEDLPHDQYGPGEYATATAKCKALDVARACKDAQLIIASDTVVEKDGRILEKAADVAQATEMLSLLSGNTHKVHTGVALVVRQAGGDKVVEFHETTGVRFAPINAAEIQAYIDTGEPWGKAGAYGIQGAAGAWVEGIQGDYFNVMGFPVHRFSATIAKLIAEGTLGLG
eukprot:jgi/Ulvmu1/12256/UM086_0049.1